MDSSPWAMLLSGAGAVAALFVGHWLALRGQRQKHAHELATEQARWAREDTNQLRELRREAYRDYSAAMYGILVSLAIPAEEGKVAPELVIATDKMMNSYSQLELCGTAEARASAQKLFDITSALLWTSERQERAELGEQRRVAHEAFTSLTRAEIGIDGLEK